MALPTQPNGSSIVPLAGAPRLATTSFTLAAQNQVTLIQNVNGVTETESVKVIQN